MKVAAAYLRVSTEKQDEYSLDSQLKLIRDYAAKNDYVVPPEFVFVDDGVSGRSAKKRTAFQSMVACAKDKSHPFEAVLLWKFSRFARNQEESIVYKSMLARCGVSVVSISEPLADGPFGSLIERILEWMDEFYSIRLSDEVRRGMLEKVSRAEPVTIPSFGYDLVDRLYVPNENADVVRRIFSDFLAGKGKTAIARELGAAGVRTRRGNPPENRWVDYILRNPVYIGKLRWSKDGRTVSLRNYNSENSFVVDGRHEPIIDSAVFDAVQEKLAIDARRPRYSRSPDEQVAYMLKGLLRCSACNSVLCYTALACPSLQCHKYAHGACDKSHSISVAKANRLVIAGLESCLASSAFPLAPQTVAQVSDGPDYDKLIAQERVKLRRVSEAYESGIDDLPEYARKKQKVLEQISAYEASRDKLAVPTARDTAAMKKKVAGVLVIIKSPDATESQKNAALCTVLSHIVYDKPASQLRLYFCP